MFVSNPGIRHSSRSATFQAANKPRSIRASLSTVAFEFVSFFIPGMVLFCALFGCPALAEEAEPLTDAQKKEVIEVIVKHLKDNYVFPDTGLEVGDQLLKFRRNGRYSNIVDRKEFCRLVDSDLVELSHDKHLRFFYDPEMNRGLREEKDEDYFPDEKMIEEERRGNFGFKQAAILEGNIGYLDLRIFFVPKSSGATAVASLSFLSNCDALIIDLRNNGGGWGDMVAFISSYFFSGEEQVQLTGSYSRPEDKHYQSWTAPWVPGKHLADTPLYILISKSTFSAAEEFCYNLKHLKRAKLVGETTRGGAHPISYKAVGREFVLMLPEMYSINPVTGSNWEGVGVKPHIEVPAEKALQVAHLKALEELKRDADNDKDIFRYQWYIDCLEAKYNPVPLAAGIAESYVGRYGSIEITLGEGVLYYCRGGRMKRKLSPLAENLFAVTDLDYLRLEFVRKGGEVGGMNVLYSDGRKSTYRKEK